jgi:dolichyl-phosphate beta-glucosyltransferase
VADALTLSLVIPAFNQASQLSDRAERLNEAAWNGLIDPRATELIVVNDDQTGETGRMAEALLAPSFLHLHTLRLQKHSGKGGAIRASTNVATAPVIAFMDVDLPIDPAQIPLLLSAIESADVAIGSGSLTDSNVESENIHRVIMGRTFNILAGAVTNVGLKETQSAFRAFRTPVARLLFHLMAVDRSAFDVEVLWLARQLGMQIAEVPVHSNDPRKRSTRPMADSVSKAVKRCRIHWRMNRPRIPALIVEAQSGNKPVRERVLSEASTTFRKTDPVLSLPQDRSLLLLPLCNPTQVNGTATRLNASSNTLKVHKRLVSYTELMKMIPLGWADTNVSARTARSPDSGSSERRQLSPRGASIWNRRPGVKSDTLQNDRSVVAP